MPFGGQRRRGGSLGRGLKQGVGIAVGMKAANAVGRKLTGKRRLRKQARLYMRCR